MARLILKASAFVSGYGALILGLLISFAAAKMMLDVFPEILFAEATSSNRILPVGSRVLYWRAAGR